MISSYISLLAGATLVALAIAWSAWRQRALPGALALMWLSLAVAEWTATYALELPASDFASKLVLAKLQYVGIVGVPVAWLVLAGWALLRFRFLQIVPFTHGAIIERLHDGVLVLDPWQRVVAMNPAAELIAGTSASAALGQPIGRVLAAYPQLLELSNAAVEARIEISIGQPASQRHYDVHCAPLSDWRGQIGGQMIMLHDVTQRKRGEDTHRFLANASTLLASSLDYETTLAAVARLVVPFLADWCMVYVCGADQMVYCAATVAADPAKQMLADDLRLGDSHGAPSYLRLPRTGQSQLIAEVTDADMIDLAADTRQLAILRAIGLRSMISVPLIARGRLLGTLLLAAVESGRSYGAHDLTLAEDLAGRMALAVDNARLFEDLHAADQAKSELLAHMSHEIRTPISGVLGMTDLLLETGLAAEQRDFIETIRTGGKALLAVVNGVLDFSKIEAGKLELEQAPFDVQACVEEAIDMVAIMAADKQLDLACVFDPAMPARLIGDMTRLRQVLVNLLSNAIKFTHQGDVFVSVAAHALDDAHYQLRFSVADTGGGIPADRMQDIFTPFSQLGAATYRRYGGTGLGLAISRRLVALMGGQIWVESQIGAGSTFSFTIAATADLDAPVVGHSAHPLLVGKRLLIVDERRRSQQALVAYAEAVGMLPFLTCSALEALTWIRQGQRFDVAIVDVRNSEMHGLTLASEIRRYHDAHALPLILVDMMGRHDVSLRDADGDYQVLLHKPLRSLQLQAALLNIFEGRAFHPNPPTKRPTGAAWPGDDDAPRILLAEDDAINQQVIMHMLQKMGYQIEVVRDGDLALAAIEQRGYDVVLLDVQMPSMDGLEVAQAIRQRFPADRQPYLVAITANVIEGAREECLSAGMDDYISKPVQVAELMQVIEMHRLRTRPSSAEASAAFQLDQLPMQGPVAAFIGAALETSQPLWQLLGEDTTWQLADLIARFLDDTTDLMNIMRAAAARGDLLAIQRAAHRLKSSSALVDAPLLSELCDQLEHALRMNAPIDAREHVERIAIEFARVKALLSA